MPAATTKPAPKTKRPAAKKDVSASYNKWKHFNGQFYTGAAVGRHHKWYYDKGEWKEVKVTPDEWDFTYNVTKRRAGHAPPGSGVPVGTEYHWFILAHQMVRKLNADDYTTEMHGHKFKLAHKRSMKKAFNISDKTQRQHLIKILKETIKELEHAPDPDLEQQPTPVPTPRTAKRR